jgi:hypothetical protein
MRYRVDGPVRTAGEPTGAPLLVHDAAQDWVLALQQASGNRAVAGLLQRNGRPGTVVVPPGVGGGPKPPPDERIEPVRKAVDAGNWDRANPPGAFYLLNGLSMDDMIQVLRGLSPGHRKLLAENLDEHGAAFDRSRIQLGLVNAGTPAGDTAFRERSEALHWAIRSGNFMGAPDGAFRILAAATPKDRTRLLTAMNRDSLDELIAHKSEGITLAGGDEVVRDVEAARAKIGPTTGERHLHDLLEGRAFAQFFAEFGPMSEPDKLRFLRGIDLVDLSRIRDHVAEAPSQDQDQIRHLVQSVASGASESLYVDGFARQYTWQPKYRVNDAREYSRYIRFGDQFDVELDINTISDDQMSDDEAEKQFRDAKPGPGGLLWPAVRNRSTLPTLWQAKQDVHRQMEIHLFPEVLAAGIFVVQYIMDVILPVAHGAAMRSLAALRRASLSGRWMKGALVVKGQGATQLMTDAEAFTKARAQRNAAAAEWETLSKAEREKIATVTGGVNTETGQATSGYNTGGKCAEDMVVEKLGGDPSKIKFSEAVRPRTGQQVPVCERCQLKYKPDQFPEGARFEGK